MNEWSTKLESLKSIAYLNLAISNALNVKFENKWADKVAEKQ